MFKFLGYCLEYSFACNIYICGGGIESFFFPLRKKNYWIFFKINQKNFFPGSRFVSPLERPAVSVLQRYAPLFSATLDLGKGIDKFLIFFLLLWLGRGDFFSSLSLSFTFVVCVSSSQKNPL